MKELYWISVLGSLKIACLIAVFVFVIFAIIAYVVYTNARDEGDEEDMVRNIKWVKKLSIGFIFSLLGTIFIPTTEQLYTIYGIGNTIDYLKENPEAKKLPDNIVNFLNEWLENKQ